MVPSVAPPRVSTRVVEFCCTSPIEPPAICVCRLPMLEVLAAMFVVLLATCVLSVLMPLVFEATCVFSVLILPVLVAILAVLAAMLLVLVAMLAVLVGIPSPSAA